MFRGDKAASLARDESLLSPELVQKVFQRVRLAERHAEAEAFAQLNNQERRTLELLTQSKTNQAIAQTMFLSEHTVRNYVSAILGKLQLPTRAATAAYAVKHHVQDHLPTP